MKLNYFGHLCFSVLAGGKTLLFDPFITPNQLAKAIDVPHWRFTDAALVLAVEMRRVLESN